jgi:Putative MetA-pathway of phenol degradation
MRILFCCCVSFFISVFFLKAQNIINTDRPDQSDGSHIVEKKHFQVETGIQFSKLDQVTTSIDNVTLIRYGVTKKFEIRLLNEYTSIHDSTRVSGEQPLTVSFKNQLCKQHGLLPKITLVSYFHLPFELSKSFHADHFGYAFTLAMRHELNSRLKLYTNVGLIEDQQTTDISYLSTAELNYNLTEKLSSFIEYYGNYEKHSSASNGMDMGFIYAIKKNLAADLAFGSPTLKLAVTKFIAFGMSVRLPE